ncbi:MAG: hypothetical protein H6609_20730, partial [Ignavibacteriales bacterium]|nr:hypothetical protein [Ignavibacteriales bacterium]
MLKTKLFILILIFYQVIVFSQGRPYEGPEDPAGDISDIRAGYMNGNRVYLYFDNTTQLANYPRRQDSKWPNNFEGVTMLDNISIIVGSEIYVKQDSIPVTNINDIIYLGNSNLIDTIYFIQGHGYSAFQSDKNYDQTVEWGLYPVPGYCNPSQ